MDVAKEYQKHCIRFQNVKIHTDINVLKVFQYTYCLTLSSSTIHFIVQILFSTPLTTIDIQYRKG